MAQSDLKFSWGAEDKLPSGKVNGKAYFATTAAYPLLAASANKAQEAFIYFDKDGIRYNVISKRALQDALRERPSVLLFASRRQVRRYRARASPPPQPSFRRDFVSYRTP